jgi:hypothetical protein
MLPNYAAIVSNCRWLQRGRVFTGRFVARRAAANWTKRKYRSDAFAGDAISGGPTSLDLGGARNSVH